MEEVMSLYKSEISSEPTIEIPLESIATTCLEDCTECYQTCFEAAMNHCLMMGGEQVAPDHFRLMMDCAEVCRMAAQFQLSSSPFISQICSLCAEICDACATSCEKLTGLEDCVLSCLKTADSCRVVADMSRH